MKTFLPDTRFTRREWWFLIALLLMIEYWIFSLSHSVSSEQTIVNYVSFASSISSILLAVTAIIYSFIQADGQQKAAGLLSFQIEEIKRASTDMTLSKEQLEGQLNRLAQVTTKVDDLSSLVGGKFTSMEDSFAELRREMAAKAKAQPPLDTKAGTNSFSKYQAAEFFLSQTTWNADLITYSLYKYMKNETLQMKWIDFVSTHFARPINELSKPDERQANYTEYLAVGVQILASLRAFGLLTTLKDVPMTLSDELKGYLSKRGPFLEKNPNEFIAESLAAISDSFKSKSQ